MRRVTNPLTRVGSRPDTSPVMPEVAAGVAVRWVDVAAPWLGAVGGDARGTVLAPAIVARVEPALRRDEGRPYARRRVRGRDLPARRIDRRQSAVSVDHDDRDLLTEAPPTPSTASSTHRSRTRRTSPASSGTCRPPHRSLVLDLPTNAAEAVRPAGEAPEPSRPVRPGRRRTCGRGDRQAPRQVRVEGDDVATSDRQRRGPRRRPRRGGDGQRN